MEFLRGIKERLSIGSRKLGIAMAFLVLAAAFIFQAAFLEEASSRAEGNRLILIDAGHGGNDPGKVGVDGVLEKDLNLALAKKLEVLLGQQDMEVMLIREEDRGLYDEDASNKKAQDMKRRCELINSEQPVCVVSLHQNSYHEEGVRGAQVFYYGTSKESEQLAKLLQAELVRAGDPESARQARANDTYYLLKKTEVRR